MYQMLTEKTRGNYKWSSLVNSPYKATLNFSTAFFNPNYSETHFLKKKIFTTRNWELLSRLVLPYFQQKISIIVMPTTCLKFSTTRRLRNAALVRLRIADLRNAAYATERYCIVFSISDDPFFQKYSNNAISQLYDFFMYMVISWIKKLVDFIVVSKM